MGSTEVRCQHSDGLVVDAQSGRRSAAPKIGDRAVFGEIARTEQRIDAERHGGARQAGHSLQLAARGNGTCPEQLQQVARAVRTRHHGPPLSGRWIRLLTGVTGWPQPCADRRCGDSLRLLPKFVLISPYFRVVIGPNWGLDGLKWPGPCGFRSDEARSSLERHRE